MTINTTFKKSHSVLRVAQYLMVLSLLLPNNSSKPCTDCTDNNYTRTHD